MFPPIFAQILLFFLIFPFFRPKTTKVSKNLDFFESVAKTDGFDLRSPPKGEGVSKVEIWVIWPCHKKKEANSLKT